MYVSVRRFLLVACLCVLSLGGSTALLLGYKPLHWHINLGLDLQGGSSLLLRADFEQSVSEILERSYADLQKKLLHQKIETVQPPKLNRTSHSIQFALQNSIPTDLLREKLKLDHYFLLEQTEENVYRLILKPESLQERKKQMITDAISNLRHRVDALGVKELSIHAQGQDKILLEVPGVENPSTLKSIVGRTAKLTFHLVDDTAETTSLNTMKLRDQYGNSYIVQRKPELTGEMLSYASAGFNSQSGLPVVNFAFNDEGSRQFAQITQKNTGRVFAIVLDHLVITAPLIREPILGGRGEISGKFTLQEVNELAIVLRSGALPIPLSILEERSIGPTLGSDSIKHGQHAVVVAFLLVALSMIVIYSYFGLIAAFALVMTLSNILLLLGVFHCTLTLPGIAGIVLTIGMSVDANVLIFEKIRENLFLHKKTPGLSEFMPIMLSGFQRAFTTISDSNMTTVIAGIVLFMIGDGPIKGFAITLCIGVLSSYVTSVGLTKIILVFVLQKNPQRLRSI